VVLHKATEALKDDALQVRVGLLLKDQQEDIQKARLPLKVELLFTTKKRDRQLLQAVYHVESDFEVLVATELLEEPEEFGPELVSDKSELFHVQLGELDYLEEAKVSDLTFLAQLAFSDLAERGEEEQVGFGVEPGRMRENPVDFLPGDQQRGLGGSLEAFSGLQTLQTAGDHLELELMPAEMADLGQDELPAAEQILCEAEAKMQQRLHCEAILLPEDQLDLLL